jgi:hypothetical protein
MNSPGDLPVGSRVRAAASGSYPLMRLTAKFAFAIKPIGDFEAFTDLILRSALLRASRRMAASGVLPSFEMLASQAPQDEAGVFSRSRTRAACFNGLLRTLTVIARSGATKQSILSWRLLDCFASPAMTVSKAPRCHVFHAPGGGGRKWMLNSAAIATTSSGFCSFML